MLLLPSFAATAPLSCTVQAEEPPQEVEEIVREESGKLVLEGGQQRTMFRLSIQLQRLEAVFNYETADAPPLGSISVQVNVCKLCTAPCCSMPMLLQCAGDSMPLLV